MTEVTPQQRKKVVFIGGGGGVTNIAPGLRDAYDFTAIVTSFDNGGSYGRLRTAFHSPLSGDVRAALAALSTNDLAALSEYRFDRGELEGHAFGNILLSAWYATQEDPRQALQKIHDMYGVKGRVLPVSLTFSDLQAELMDRTMLRGESTIDQPHAKSQVRIRRVWLDPDAVPTPGVLEAIAAADLIIVGPGDVYTSIIPNFLVEKVASAVVASPAKKVYFCNINTRYGQTNGFAASDHVRAIEAYLRPNTFAKVVLCSSSLPEEFLLQLKKHREDVVRQDVDVLKAAGYAVLSRDLLDGVLLEQNRVDAVRRTPLRYAPEKVRAVVAELLA
jgi:uncharacterized cofD-like protein